LRLSVPQPTLPFHWSIRHPATGKPRHAAQHPLTPGHGCKAEVDWWIRQLDQPSITCIIPRPVEVVDVRAYLDASSKIGIGVVIGNFWNAWRLIPRWKTGVHYKRNIQWAKAVGFEFCCRYVFDVLKLSRACILWYDNVGVTELWWKQRSCNIAVNKVFKWLGKSLHEFNASVYTRYVKSAKNPTDQPSRFDFSALCSSHLLPCLCIPAELSDLVINHREPPNQHGAPIPVSLPNCKTLLRCRTLPPP
jgi:hypothetical protein